MNIGQFKKNDKGVFYGYIAAAKMDLGRLALKPVTSANERAPLFEVVAQNPGNRTVRIGALWEATANGTGEIFLQGSVDDPSLPDRLPIALFSNRDGDGYNVAWQRPRRRAPVIDAVTSGSQASDVGDLTDEEVPY